MDEQTTTVIYLNQFEAHGLNIGNLYFEVKIMELKREYIDLENWVELVARGRA